MKIKIIFSSILFLIIGFAKAQFQVGHMSINFKDASRSGGYTISGGITMPGTGRTIGTEVYYPAAAAGNNVAVSSGTFPVVVIGHGFQMTWDSYDNIYNRLAQKGFIVALPRTEGGLSPAHADFGADLRLVASLMLALNTSTVSGTTTFNGKVSNKTAIGGHSMGAGSSFLAAANNTTLTCLFNMAAAETNPSSINSATTITVPSLVIGGQRDCVADTTVQNSHYNNIASTKKFKVFLKDLTHCDFGNGGSFQCTFGQGVSGCGNTLSNTAALNRYMTYIEPFLTNLLKDNCPAGKQFMDTIQAASSVRVGRRIQGTLVSLPTITINGGGVSICNGNQVTLTASGANTYTWTGGVTNASAFTPTTTQNYTVTGADAQGCTNTNTTSITVNQGPTVTITPTTSAICQGQSVSLTASGATSYTWSGGITNGATVSPSTTTAYTVIAAGGSTCTSTTVKTITVNNPPTISVTPTLSSICNGQSVNLSASGANTYTWSHGGSNGSAVSPTVNTTYTVNATSVAGCTNTAVKSISITSAPTLSVNSGAICSGESFTINPTGASSYTVTGGNFVVSPTNTATYSITGSSASGCLATNTVVSTVSVTVQPTITVNSGSICSGQSFTMVPNGASSYTYSGGSSVVQPTSNSSYTITGSNVAGCNSTPVVAQVTVNPIPTLSVSSSEAIVCAGQSVVITVSGANTYTWNTSENTSSITVTPSTTTNYTVTGTNGFGCNNQTTFMQNVSTCTGIESLNNDLISGIYPNPSNGLFNITTVNSLSIEVYDALGQLVKIENINSGTTTIDLSDKEKGLYFIKLKHNNNIQNVKIILQ